MEKVQHLTGYEEFEKFVDNIKSVDSINFYFTGSKNDSGISWCPDCVEALPHVEKAFKKYGGNSTLIQVDVGDRTFWKNMSNPFRLKKDLHLMVIPTLVRYKSPKRLDGDQCSKDNLLEMFFTDENE